MAASMRSGRRDRKSTRLNSSHVSISYAVFCLKKQKNHLSTFFLTKKTTPTNLINISQNHKPLSHRSADNQLMLSHPIFIFFFNDTATTEIYTLSLHDALPIWQA